MGKQVRIKGYQSLISSNVYIDGWTFLPEDSNFLEAFQIPNFLSVSPKIRFRGYLSYNFVKLLGPGYFLPKEVITKEVNNQGSNNPFIYVELQVSKILYFSVKGYFFNSINFFDFAVEIDFAEVSLLKEKNPYPEYGNHVEININHGCGVYSNPIELKAHQVKIRKDFPDFQSIESVVHLDLKESLERGYYEFNSKDHHPNQILCFLTPTEPDGISYKNSSSLNIIENLLAKMEMVHWYFKVYITNKNELVDKITKRKLINPENLDSNGIVMLIRENKTYDKDLGDYVYSYRVISNETEILKLLQR
jgi:hypothetical protein